MKITKRCIVLILLLMFASMLLAACTTASKSTDTGTETAAVTEPKKEKTGENSVDYINAGLEHSKVTDKHRKIESDSDMSALEKLYEGYILAAGDIHNHTYYSDGYNTFEEVKQSADKLGYDFFGPTEHNNYKQLEEPLWQDDRNMVCMEYTTNFYHFNVYFREKEKLAKMAEFVYDDPIRERKYTMSFNIPEQPVISPRYWGQGLMYSFSQSLTPEATFYEQLVEYVHSLGGIIQINHAGHSEYGKTLKSENVYGVDMIEIFNPVENEFNDVYYYKRNRQSLDLWVSLLNKGYKVYGTVGSDQHHLLTDSSITNLYVKKKNYADFYDALKSGNFFSTEKIGLFEIKMCIGDVIMGGTTIYSADKTLKIRINAKKIDGKYGVTVYTDRGIAYYNTYSSSVVEIEIPIEDRLYYRLEIDKAGEKVTINNENFPYYLAFSNPIFLRNE